MKIPYRNVAGNSGVRAFELRADAIVIHFTDGDSYLYDHARPGKHHVEKMIRLAQEGRGLATYINQYVRKVFATKL